MQFPTIRRFQFLDQTSFNAAVQSLFANDVMLGSTLFMPGLVNANNLSVSESGLQVTLDLPHPFAVLFQSGVIALAHGVTDNADTDSYQVDLTSLVPTAGSVTAYIIASLVSIEQQAFTLTGPPIGHPDYDPNFQSSTAQGESQYSLAVTATTTAPDNMTTFELGRYTLSAGQVSLPAIDTQYQTMVGINAMMSLGSLNTLRPSGFVDTPVANTAMMAYTFPYNASIPSGLSSSAASCLVAPTNTVSYKVLYYPAQSGTPTQIGTLTFAAGRFNGSFSGSAQAVNPGDRIAVVGPLAADPTLSGVSVTLIANLSMA